MSNMALEKNQCVTGSVSAIDIDKMHYYLTC